MPTYTYTDTLLTNRDYLRFRLCDTNETYVKFYDEELDEILSLCGDDIDTSTALGYLILSHDPDRLCNVFDGCRGALPIATLMDLYRERSDEWAGLS